MLLEKTTQFDWVNLKRKVKYTNKKTNTFVDVIFYNEIVMIVPNCGGCIVKRKKLRSLIVETNIRPSTWISNNFRLINILRDITVVPSVYLVSGLNIIQNTITPNIFFGFNVFRKRFKHKHRYLS